MLVYVFLDFVEDSDATFFAVGFDSDSRVSVLGRQECFIEHKMINGTIRRRIKITTNDQWCIC